MNCETCLFRNSPDVCAECRSRITTPHPPDLLVGLSIEFPKGAAAELLEEDLRLIIEEMIFEIKRFIETGGVIL